MLFVLEHVARWRDGVEGLPDEAETRTVLEEAGKVCAEVVAPVNRAGDVTPAAFCDGAVTMPPGWKEAFSTWAGAGWNGISSPAAHGGAGMPAVLGAITMEMFTSGCMALGTLPVLNQGAVEALAAHASPELQARYLPKLISGEWGATMDLTEPQAGSDLSGMKTAAVPAADGTYRIRGRKIYITYGEHDLTPNIVHLVLARLPDAPAGTRGISLFIVPKFIPEADGTPGVRNDMVCLGIEKKLGIRSSPTCTMAYGEKDGAIGWLVGEPHQGLRCMFTMMNRARMSIGIQGVAIGERAFQQALAYAKERRQGRRSPDGDPVAIIEHPDVVRNLMMMASLVAASRALAYRAGAEIHRAAHATDPAVRTRAQAQADLLTPVVKAYATDAGVTVGSIGIQIHGGAGFVEETGAAQHWRDARIAPIYEGTNGIQAIDLVTRKVMRDGGAALGELIDEVRSVATGFDISTDEAMRRAGAALRVACDSADAATAWMLDTERTADARLAVATPYAEMVAIVLAASLLCRGAVAAGGLPNGEGHRLVARFYVEAILPHVHALSREVIGGGGAVSEAGKWLARS